MKTIAIIPARGGSKRLPNKNVLRMGNIPLLVHSILYAKVNTSIIDDVYVSTDNNEIKEIALSFGAKVIDRPKYLSGDEVPTINVLKHALECLDDTIVNVVLLQPTNPLRPINLLKEAFLKFTSEALDSLFTVSRNHQKFGVIKESKFSPFNYKMGQRSQDLKPLYFENGLLYIAKASLIKEEVLINENSFPLIINHLFASIDIDTIEDFEYAEYLLLKNKELKGNE